MATINVDYDLLQVWNEDLASLAQEWAEGCRWGHGQPEHDLPYENLGKTGKFPDWFIRLFS